MLEIRQPFAVFLEVNNMTQIEKEIPLI